MNLLLRFRSTLLLQALLLLLALEQPAAAQQPIKPDLYAVCIGVSKYEHAIFENGVRFASKDAQDVAAVLRSQENKLFGRVEVMTLTDAQATRASIEKAMQWLREKATAQAYTLVFLAGHAGPDTVGRYSFVPHDGHPLLSSTMLPGAIVRDSLQTAAGKRFLVLDTCHAGGFMSKGTDFATFAACMAQEVSSEEPVGQNGFFTRAFVEALTGQADANRDGLVTLAELDAYVADRLQSLTLGAQQFTMHRPASIQSRLPLAMVLPMTTGPMASNGQISQIGR